MNKSKGLAGDPPGAWREVVDAEGGLGVGDGALEAGGRVLGLRVQLHGVARLQPPRVARLEIELETKVHKDFTIILGPSPDRKFLLLLLHLKIY